MVSGTVQGHCEICSLNCFADGEDGIAPWQPMMSIDN